MIKNKNLDASVREDFKSAFENGYDPMEGTDEEWANDLWDVSGADYPKNTVYDFLLDSVRRVRADFSQSREIKR